MTCSSAKYRLKSSAVSPAVLDGNYVQLLDLENNRGIRVLSDVLHAERPIEAARALLGERSIRLPLADVVLLPPVDRQEVWAAGVTYKRSQECAGTRIGRGRPILRFGIQRPAAGAVFQGHRCPRRRSNSAGAGSPGQSMERAGAGTGPGDFASATHCRVYHR